MPFSGSHEIRSLTEQLMHQLDVAEEALDHGSPLPANLIASIHTSADELRNHSRTCAGKAPRLIDQASSINFALRRLDQGIDTSEKGAQRTSIKVAKTFLAHNLGVQQTGGRDQLFAGPANIDEVCGYIQNPTSHPHWIRFQENMNKSFPKMSEEEIKEVFRNVLLGISWNLLATIPLQDLIDWNPEHASNAVIRIREGLILWQKGAREGYGNALEILNNMPIEDEILKQEIKALPSNPANIKEALKKAQILVDEVRKKEMGWNELPEVVRERLNRFSPEPPFSKEGPESAAEIYSALQQHTMSLRSGRGSNPYFEYALEKILRSDKQACESLDKKFRKAPVSLWGGGIAISDHAHAEGYQVLEHSKLGAAFNGVQFHPQYPTYEPLWERLSQEFVRYHIDKQIKDHPDNPPALTLHTRSLDEKNIGQMIELPTALGSSRKGGLPRLTLHVRSMLTDEENNPIAVPSEKISMSLNSKKGSAELLNSLYRTFIEMHDEYKELQAEFERQKSDPNYPIPENYNARRALVNANLWGIQQALMIEAQAEGYPPPPKLSPIAPWPVMGSSSRNKIRPKRSNLG